MEDKKNICFLKNRLQDQKGQGMVEYILLLVVISALSSFIFKSQAFKQFLGEDSSFFGAIASRLEFSYRYGHNGEEDKFGGYSSSGHELYQKDGSKSRFFGPKVGYGEQ